MIYAGMVILIFTAVQLLIALANLIFSQPFPKIKPPGDELISVLIPARNEEKNISKLLTELQNQHYRHIEILVFNDQSTDGTELILQQFSEKDKRISFINSYELPEGWLGKNFACHSLSLKAKGNYLLFLDADVSIEGSIIEKMLAFIEKYNLSLLSIFPRQIMKTLGEKVTVPTMNYILLSLLPLILVRKSKSPALSAANGQCMFFLADSYKRIQPHRVLRNNKVEDIEIARLLKRKKEKVACMANSPEISCHMYQSFSEAVNGFSKNVIMFFGGSFVLAVVFWLVTSLGFVVVWFSFSFPMFIIYLCVIVLIRIIVSVVSNQPVLNNLVMAVPQQMAIGMFIVQAFINRFKKQYIWKGRNIS
jgi:glycosyltransferase involved in cell wall biosynthesis